MHNGASIHPASTATDATGALQRGVEQAGDTLHSTIDKVAQPVLAAVDRASTGAHQAVDRVASGVHAAAEKVDAQAQRLQDMPHRAADHARDYVRSRPLQTVALAAALGWLFGRLGGHR